MNVLMSVSTENSTPNGGHLMSPYPFPQQASIIPGEIAIVFKDFKKLNVPGDHILDLYLRAISTNSIPNDLHNPYQYLKKVEGLTTGPNSVRYTALETVFNNNFQKLRSFAPLAFLSAFESAYCHAVDDSGLNNGMIYERFFAQLKPNDRIVIIDPPLSFIRKLLNDEALTHTHIQLLFSSERYAETLRNDPQLKRFYLQYFDRAGRINADKILIFGASRSYEQIKTLFETLPIKISPHRNPILYALLPTAYMDRREPGNLRNYIGAQYSINLIVLTPAKAANIPPQKRCMLVLKHGSNQSSKVTLQNTQCIGEEAVTGLIPLTHYKIDLDYLMRSSASLHSLYTQASSAHSTSKKRKRAEVYRFSKELSIGYSISQSNGKYRAKCTPYAPPSSRQLRENHEGRGSALCSAFSSKLYGTREALLENMEQIYFHSTHIRSASQALIPQFKSKPCSLKTFWYLHQEELATDARYDSKLTEEIFLLPQSWNTELCALNAYSNDSSQIKQILDAVAESKSMSNTRKRNFVKQIEVIFDLVSKTHPDAPSNPITPIFRELLERPDALHAMRDNLVRRSWSHFEEQRLLDILKNDTTSPALALASQIRFYTGISIRETCALIWEDYQRIPGVGIHTLTIRRTFKGNGTTPIPLATKDLYRSIPVCRPLALALSQRKSILSETYSAEKLDTQPIISINDTSDSPIRPETLIAYERKLFRQLNLPELRLHVPSETHSVELDINDYHGDWMRANFKHHCQHDGKMDTDDIRYCLGVRPNTTAAQHYNSNLKHTSQLRMYCAINRWAKFHQLTDTTNKTFRTIRLGKSPQSISSMPTLCPTEFVLDIPTNKANHNSTLELSIFARYGMGIVVEEITKEVDSE